MPIEARAPADHETQSDSWPAVTWSGFATVAGLLTVPVTAWATPTFTISPTLNPGDHYRIVFVTSTSIAATSSSIATYNTFVSDAAALGTLPSATWSAIASDPSTSASSNIACTPSCASDPIFLVDGTEVATSTSNLFSGSILNPISEDENGSTVGSYVWTGSNADGGGTSGHQLGTSLPTVGDTGGTNSDWIGLIYDDSSAAYPLYAISSDLVVPSLPAPGGVPLLALGGLLTFAARKFGRSKRTDA